MNALKWMRIYDVALSECSRKKLFCKDISEIEIKPKKQIPPNFYKFKVHYFLKWFEGQLFRHKNHSFYYLYNDTVSQNDSYFLAETQRILWNKFEKQSSQI